MAKPKPSGENKIVLKVGLIENGNLFTERVIELEWPENWTPDFERFINDLIAWNESDITCIVNKIK